MGRKKKNKKKSLMAIFDGSRSFGVNNFLADVSPETKRGIGIIFLVAIALLSLLGIFDLSGEFGRIIVNILAIVFGRLVWLFPALALLFAYFLLREEKYDVRLINYIGALILILGLTGLWHLWYLRDGVYLPLILAQEQLGGGYAGFLLSALFLKFSGFWGAVVLAAAVFFVGMLLTFETSIHGLLWPARLLSFIGLKFRDIFVVLKDNLAERRLQRQQKTDNYDYEEEDDDYAEEEVEEEDEEVVEDEPALPQADSQFNFARKEIAASDPADADMADIAKPKRFGRKIELPFSLLESRSGKPTSGDIKANQETIKKTLANFGILVEMAEINVGPTVTQYTFRPAEGVKLSRVVNLSNDLALALAAHPIRIEAPIPGRSLVGIEVPNKQAAKVTMFEILSSKAFKKRESNLSIALGKDVSGQPYFGRIDKMPHLLIAGATGSGKSVCINSLIISLLYQNSPDDLKFILVDPKRVELPIYNNIPYLLTPVITDVKKTINALKWTIIEMEKRFELLSKVHKRNIEIYNQTAKEKLPYIVFIIDELADLMSVASSDIENGIVRLAQMARAVGIHLVLATQRPSVEVITGLIKANIPGRIAFSVSSLIDSRTILDESGAEKLVGRGDMLYLGPEFSKPKRIQGVFLSDKEIKNIVDYIKDQGEAEYVDAVVEKQSGSGIASGSFGSDDDGDNLLPEAKEVIVQSGKASASLLQRRLKIGYARAARILDLLEDQGVIGPADGAKPREVYLDKLGVDNQLEFAAKEYGLEGELVDYHQSYDDSENEAENLDVENEEIEETEDDLDQEAISDDDWTNEDKIETDDVDRDEEVNHKKKSYQDDEWT